MSLAETFPIATALLCFLCFFVQGCSTPSTPAIRLHVRGHLLMRDDNTRWHTAFILSQKRGEDGAGPAYPAKLSEPDGPPLPPSTDSSAYVGRFDVPSVALFTQNNAIIFDYPGLNLVGLQDDSASAWEPPGFIDDADDITWRRWDVSYSRRLLARTLEDGVYVRVYLPRAYKETESRRRAQKLRGLELAYTLQDQTQCFETDHTEIQISADSYDLNIEGPVLTQPNADLSRYMYSGYLQWSVRLRHQAARVSL